MHQSALSTSTSLRAFGLAQPAHSRSALHRSVCARRSTTQAALFGWDPLLSKEEQARRRQEQEEVQRAVLKRRRGNSWQQSVNERRAEVKKYATDKEYKKQVDEARKKAKPKKEDPGLRGIIVPLPPFGDSEMDNGERFDLASPWIDEGWSDPTESPLKSFKKLFSGFGKVRGKKAEEEEPDWRGMELARRAQNLLQGKGNKK